MLSAISGGSAVKSVQTVSINLGSATSATATITSVSTAKSVIIPNGYITNATTADNPAKWIPDWTLTNATTVTVTCQTAGTTGFVVKATVIEYA